MAQDSQEHPTQQGGRGDALAWVMVGLLAALLLIMFLAREPLQGTLITIALAAGLVGVLLTSIGRRSRR